MGLLRFLRLLSHHPWRVTPLLVDPDGEMSAQQRETVLRQHYVRRCGGVLFGVGWGALRERWGVAWGCIRGDACWLIVSHAAPMMLFKRAVL